MKNVLKILFLSVIIFSGGYSYAQQFLYYSVSLINNLQQNMEVVLKWENDDGTYLYTFHNMGVNSSIVVHAPNYECNLAAYKVICANYNFEFPGKGVFGTLNTYDVNTNHWILVNYNNPGGMPVVGNLYDCCDIILPNYHHRWKAIPHNLNKIFYQIVFY